MAENEANSDYNALQLSFRGNALKKDLTFQAGYTYSHSNDPAAGSSNGFDLNSLSNP